MADDLRPTQPMPLAEARHPSEASTRAAPIGGAGSPHATAGASLGRGSLVGRWVILDRLGAGGMGVVYAAYDPELDRRVAIKLVTDNQALGSEDSARVARVLREAQSMARLSHPNVVTVYDVGSVDAGVYIAMEHIDGRTLTAWLAERRRSQKEILHIFRAAGRGIQAAHAAGLIHRDFKPDNVMIGCDGRVRVLDFGLARPASTVEPAPADQAADVSIGLPLNKPRSFDLTLPGTAMGTPRYMAPEQHLGLVADRRSDIYAFCVALWEALYGRPAFTGESVTQLARRIIAGDRNAETSDVSVPRWLRALLVRGMAPDPAARFPNIEAVLKALDQEQAYRARWMALGVGLALVATGGGFAVHRAAQISQCRAFAHVLEGTWDAGRKAAVQAAFAREDEAFSAASWTSVSNSFDSYHEALISAGQTTCEAAKVYGTTSRDVFARQEACLARRWHRFAALSEALAEGGTKTMLGAATAAQGLASLEPCLDVERVVLAPPPPGDPTMRTRVEELGQELDRIDGLGVAGDFDGLLGRIDEVVSQARAIGYRPVLAEALLARGYLLTNLAHADEARAALLEALEHADATGHNWAVVAVSTVLLRLEAQQGTGFDLADLHGRRAQAMLDRIGPDPQLQIALWTNLGGLRRAQGRGKEAVELQQRAADASLEARRPSLHRLPILIALANALMVEEAYDQGEHVLEQARSIVDADLGPRHPNAAILLSAFAQLRRQQGRHEESITLQRQARDTIVAVLGPKHPNVGAIANNTGMELASLGRTGEAATAYGEALAIMEATYGPDHLSVARALQNLALLEIRLGRGQQALTHMRRVLEIREPKLGIEHEDIAYAQDLLGDAYALAGEPEQARRSYRAAMATFVRIGKERHQAYSYVGLARLDLQAHRYPEAIANCERALALHGEDTDDGHRARARFVLARALHGARQSRSRVDELLRQAEQQYRDAGPEYAGELAELQQWARAKG